MTILEASMRQLRGVLAVLFFGAVLTGCGGLTIPLARPTPSGPSFSDPAAKKATLKLVDGRAGAEANFHLLVAALSRADIKFGGIESPMSFLAENLGKELAGRGYPVTIVTDPGAQADIELKVTRYRIVSRRVNGFTPWETMHQFSGVLSAGSKQRVIYAYFFNGKVPVWSIKEIYAPCFDVPQSILVKDVASKINRALLGFRSSDAVVDQLAKRAAPKDDQNDGPFWEIVELGGTNNPKAMEILKKYTSHKDEFVRAVALDAIGMLGPEKELAFLKERFASLKSLDKYMALKAIGDAGDAESLKFVSDQSSTKLYSDEAGMKYLVDLYGGK
jgi:hypothetical protein